MGEPSLIVTKDIEEKKEESLEPTISESQVKGKKKKRKSQIVPSSESIESAENVGSEEPSLIVDEMNKGTVDTVNKLSEDTLSTDTITDNLTEKKENIVKEKVTKRASKRKRSL